MTLVYLVYSTQAHKTKPQYYRKNNRRSNTLTHSVINILHGIWNGQNEQISCMLVSILNDNTHLHTFKSAHTIKQRQCRRIIQGVQTILLKFEFSLRRTDHTNCKLAQLLATDEYRRASVNNSNLVQSIWSQRRFISETY